MGELDLSEADLRVGRVEEGDANDEKEEEEHDGVEDRQERR